MPTPPRPWAARALNSPPSKKTPPVATSAEPSPCATATAISATTAATAWAARNGLSAWIGKSQDVDKMGKRRKTAQSSHNGPSLFTSLQRRRRSGLVLRRFLAEEAEKFFLRGQQQDQAYEIVKRWADLETAG